jgi:hypothetical protein
MSQTLNISIMLSNSSCAVPDGLGSASWWGVEFKSTVQSSADPKVIETVCLVPLIRLLLQMSCHQALFRNEPLALSLCIKPFPALSIFLLIRRFTL